MYFNLLLLRYIRYCRNLYKIRPTSNNCFIRLSIKQQRQINNFLYKRVLNVTYTDTTGTSVGVSISHLTQLDTIPGNTTNNNGSAPLPVYGLLLCASRRTFCAWARLAYFLIRGDKHQQTIEKTRIPFKVNIFKLFKICYLVLVNIVL